MYDYLETSPGERPTPNTAWQGYELNISSLESIFSDCADFERRDIYFGLDKKACVNLCWIDGLTDGGSISGDIIRPLTDLLRSSRSDFPDGCLGMVMHGLAYSANAEAARQHRRRCLRSCARLLRCSDPRRGRSVLRSKKPERPQHL